jgi:hypothetical protein
MQTLLSRPKTAVYATLTRESISWRSVDVDTVEIAIDIVNDADECTTPAVLVVEAAPFGAFVPNLPLTRVAVGSLDPGEGRRITKSVPRSVLDGINRAFTTRRSSLGGALQGFMDPASHPHWIGNFNVYFEGQRDKAVERHRAFGLKVPAGSNIGALFIVLGAAGITVETATSDERWIASVRCVDNHLAMLSVQTPGEPGASAQIVANVIRTDDGKTIPVEFEFETVDGWGETLGCVQV